MIFDLDGVVADTHPIHRRAWRQLLLERNLSVSEDQLDFILEGRRRHEILRHFLGDLSDCELLACAERKDGLFYEWAGELRAIPGVVELLAQLRDSGVPMALATSAGKDRAYFVLEQLGVRNYFDAVLTSDDVPNSKPDPAIYSRAAACLRVDPERSIVAEDSRSGVRAAKSAGMKCLGIGSGVQASKLRDEGADYVITDFKGLSLPELQALF